MTNCVEFDKDLLIFTFKFNKEIESEIINECIVFKIKKIIFNNFNETEQMFIHSNNYDWKNKIYWRGSRFNKSISEFSRINLEHLVLGAKFNQPLNNLPNSLKTLILGIEFNQPLDNLPNRIKILCCQNCIGFSHNLDYLPESLEHIVIPYNFDKSLNNLPQNIRILDLYRISYNIGFLTNMLSNLPANLENIIVEDLNCFKIIY